MDSMSRRERERQTREEDIINSAEQVFSSMGYNGASMEEIAKAAQFTRKTVYQYFADKEDLYLAVVIRGLQRLTRFCQEEIKTGNTGFEKLERLALAYYRFYKEFPSTLNLMNYVGYINSKNDSQIKRQEFNQCNELLAKEVANVIELGKADGSIRSDLDTMQATLSTEFLITGFFNLLSISGPSFMSHFGLDQEAFIQFNINILCDAFRAK